MRVVIGDYDLWTYPADWRCITTNFNIPQNGALVMGRGSALQAKLRFPGVDERWGKWTQTYGKRLFVDKFAKLIAFPVKYDWRHPASPVLIEQSAKQLNESIAKFGLKNIVIARPALGNGWLTWKQVEPAMCGLSDEVTVLLNASDL